MALLIPAGFCQVNLFWTGASVPTGAQCTFALDAQASAQTPTEIGNVVVDAYQTAGFSINLANNVNLVKVLVKEGPNATGPSAEVATGLNSSGGTAGTANTATLVSKNTALGGRQGRGRMFLPGVQEDQIDGAGVIAPAVVAALQSDVELMFSEIAVSDLFPVLLHDEASPITTPTPITSFTVQSTAATQRRRMRR